MDDIKMDAREIGCSVLKWVSLVEDMDYWRSLVNAVINLRVS
jgi:hypothetical protein